MPYLKPGEIIEAQESIAHLLSEAGLDMDYLSNESQKFMRKNPVTGENQVQIRIAKVNGVWVDLDDVEKAEEQGHVYQNYGLDQ